MIAADCHTNTYIEYKRSGRYALSSPRNAAPSRAHHKRIRHKRNESNIYSNQFINGFYINSNLNVIIVINQYF